MAGITSLIQNNRAGVVGVRIQKTVSCMAGYTFCTSIRVRGCRSFAYRDAAVVTICTTAGDACVIETAVCADVQETAGCVAIITFTIGGYMCIRFADRDSAIVAFAARAKHFAVINLV